MQRSDVKEFFERGKPSQAVRKIAFGLLALGGLIFLFSSYFWGLVWGGIGGFLLYRELNKVDDVSALYAALQHFKHRDISNLLQRAFKRADVDIDDLVNFDAEDMLDFLEGPAAGGGDLDRLQSKTVVLFGPSDRLKHVKLVKVDGRTVVEINPWQVSVLFLTKTQLITYEAQLDLTRGDLDSEGTHRMFLADVVQIGTTTNTQRYRIDPTNAKVEDSVFRDMKKLTGKDSIEIVRRDHAVRISKTDGQSLRIPIGAPEWRDGSVGMLDDAEQEDDRYVRIAQQMSNRINAVKMGA